MYAIRSYYVSLMNNSSDVSRNPKPRYCPASAASKNASTGAIILESTVITSYSIHYTKLYDVRQIARRLLTLEPSVEKRERGRRHIAVLPLHLVIIESAPVDACGGSRLEPLQRHAKFAKRVVV